jgi:radical SAM superfamily enzyme YgiQ (UPF0313 family)
VHLDPEQERTNKHTPLAVAYLASYVRKYGGFNNIVIVDKENPIKKIKKEKPDIVGISAMTYEFPQAKQIAKELKLDFDIPIIIGGHHISLMPHHFDKGIFDLAVIGEGEQTLLELMQLFEKEGRFSADKLKNIKGILYRDNGSIKTTEPRPLIENLDLIPFPALDLLDMSYYLQPRREAFSDKIDRYLSVITTRGCPYKCIFCPAFSLWKRPRFHSAEYVVNEMKHLIEKYKITGIRIWDDTFTMNPARLKEIARLIKEEKINEKVEFYVYGRANLINEDMCKLLKQMNVAHISFGLESGSERILKYLKGGTVTVADNRRAIKLCKQFGISVQGFFIIGSPGETEEDLKQTMELLKNENIDYAYVLQLTPYPATELWDQLEKEGIVSEETDITHPEYYNPDLILTREMPQEKFKEWYDLFQRETKKKWYGKAPKFKPKYLKFLLSPRFVASMVKRPREILNYLKYFKSVGR